jgi:hypothetical protein
MGESKQRQRHSAMHKNMPSLHHTTPVFVDPLTVAARETALAWQQNMVREWQFRLPPKRSISSKHWLH